MKFTATALPLLAGLASAGPIEERQSCPGVHVFGARETTVAQGYGTSQGLVDMVVRAYSGATKEAIVYPACGGQSSCGGASYDSSQQQGTAAVVKAVTAFNQKCPNTKIVLVGYSQGGQIFDNAMCGGAGSTLTGAALKAVRAAIFMGDPRYVSGSSYNVGTCKAKGVSASSSSSSERVVLTDDSSTPAPAASNARRRALRFCSRTATRRTRTAATATTPTRTSSTSTSTASRLLRLSRASSMPRHRGGTATSSGGPLVCRGRVFACIYQEFNCTNSGLWPIRTRLKMCLA